VRRERREIREKYKRRFFKMGKKIERVQVE
jgi:hypothetical protein